MEPDLVQSKLFLPEIINNHVNRITEMPASTMNSLQGASTAFKTSDTTIHPIGDAVQLA